MLPAQVPAPAAEVQALGQALNVMLSDIKAGKAITVIATDALPSLLAAATAFQNLGADAKLAANQAYLAYSIAAAYES